VITHARTWGCALALLLPSVVAADEVLLRGGGRVSGIIVERTDKMVVLETGPGRVSVPLSRVERIDDGESALQSFEEQAALLDPTDAAGWARLARWAEDHDLATTARETWERVLALDPNHPEANAAFGRSAVDGVWMSEADARRRQGYVPWNGGWVTPSEHEALVRERAADRQDARERRELGVREAEARAREAEARARAAEANAEQTAEPVGGIPYEWVIYGGSGGGFGPGAGCCQGHGGPPHARPPDADPPPPPQVVAAPQKPSSIGPLPAGTGRSSTSGAIRAPRAGGSSLRD